MITTSLQSKSIKLQVHYVRPATYMYTIYINGLVQDYNISSV